ncbi:MAG TPA: hypothetical protein VGM68_03520 [Rhizomicrobium sp.]
MVPITDIQESAVPSPAEPLAALPAAMLEQLARLHRETSQVSRTTKFLGSAVHAASAFMLMGGCVLLWSGGQTIGQNFLWAVLVLIGVAALLYSFIRTHAAAFDRMPASMAARNLRGMVLYLGLAWGAGAFLVLPGNAAPVTAILFAVLPALVLSGLLHDFTGLAAFQIPASVLTAAALFARPWQDPGLAMAAIFTLQSVLFAMVALRHRISLPAGLALR